MLWYPYISQKNISLNVHLLEWTFGQMDIFSKTYFPKWTLARMDIWPNRHFPENLFSRMGTCQNGHFPKYPFSRKDTCQNVHLMLAIIIQDDEIKLFCSVRPVNKCFISGLVFRLCTVHFCIVLRVPHWKKTCQYYWIDPWLSVTYYKELHINSL